jgi:general secretion pathway protein G
MGASNRAGMGVAELFGVLAVVVAIAFAFYYYVDNRAAEGKRTLTIRRMQVLEDALARYMVDCGGDLPSQKQGLKALLQKPDQTPVPRGWHGPYVKTPAVLRDGWGRPFRYYCRGGADPGDPTRFRPYDLASYGRDGQEGGKALDRDVRSWDRATMAP